MNPMHILNVLKESKDGVAPSIIVSLLIENPQALQYLSEILTCSSHRAAWGRLHEESRATANGPLCRLLVELLSERGISHRDRRQEPKPMLDLFIRVRGYSLTVIVALGAVPGSTLTRAQRDGPLEADGFCGVPH